MQRSIRFLCLAVVGLCYYLADNVETSAVDLSQIKETSKEIQAVETGKSKEVEEVEEEEEGPENRQGPLAALLPPNKGVIQEATKTVFVQVTKVLTKHPVCMTVYGVKPPCLPRPPPPPVYHKPLSPTPPPPPPHDHLPHPHPHHPPPPPSPHHPPHDHPAPAPLPPHPHHDHPAPPPPPPHPHHPPHDHPAPPPPPPHPHHPPHAHPAPPPHPHGPHEPHTPDCYREHGHEWNGHEIEPSAALHISGSSAAIDDILVVPGLKAQDSKLPAAKTESETEDAAASSEEEPSSREAKFLTLDGSLLDSDDLDIDGEEYFFMSPREEIEGSLLETPALEKSEGRIILGGGGQTKIVTKTLWVTKIRKVTDYGVTATLVAHNCIPTNNKIPLCHPEGYYHHKPHSVYKEESQHNLEEKAEETKEDDSEKTPVDANN